MPDLYEKQKFASFTFKEYKFPSGRIEYIQGYENLSIDKCLVDGVSEDLICVKNIPSFSYLFEDEKHVYYPDFFIKDENIVVETKSEYTFNLHKERNIEKFKAVLNNNNEKDEKNNYKIRVMIYNNKKELIVDKLFTKVEEIVLYF